MQTQDDLSELSDLSELLEANFSVHTLMLYPIGECDTTLKVRHHLFKAFPHLT